VYLGDHKLLEEVRVGKAQSYPVFESAWNVAVLVAKIVHARVCLILAAVPSLIVVLDAVVVTHFESVV